MVGLRMKGFLFALLIFTSSAVCMNAAADDLPPLDFAINKTYPVTKKATEVILFRRWVQEGNYKELNAALDKLSAETKQDIKHEWDEYYAYSLLAICHEKYIPFLNKWIESEPENTHAWLLRGITYSQLAWQARGHKYRKDTSDEQFKGMYKYMDSAIPDLKKAIEVDASNWVAYSYLQMDYSSTNKKYKAFEVYRDAEKRFPNSLILRRDYIGFQAPRWHGSHERMQALINRAEPYIADNSELKLLPQYILRDLYTGPGRNEEKAMDYINEAVAYGDNPDILNGLSIELIYNKEFQKAHVAAVKSLQLNPYVTGPYYDISRTEFINGNLSAAADAINFAYVMNPFNEGIMRLRYKTANNMLLDLDIKRREGGDVQLSEINKLIAMSFDASIGYQVRALYYQDHNQMKEAEESLQISVDKDPDCYACYYSLTTMVADEHSDWERVICLWQDYLENHSDNTDAQLRIAWAYHLSGNNADARLWADKSLAGGNNEATELLKSLP